MLIYMRANLFDLYYYSSRALCNPAEAHAGSPASLPNQAATILCRLKLFAEAMCGRLATCGGLAIRLPRISGNLPERLRSAVGQAILPADAFQAAPSHQVQS